MQMTKPLRTRATESSRSASVTSQQSRTKELEDETKGSAIIKTEAEDAIMKRVKHVGTKTQAMIEALTQEYEAMHLKFTKKFRALITTMVMEIVSESVCNSISRSLCNCYNSLASSSLKLHFVDALPDTIFTLTKMQDQGASLTVKLQDSVGSRVQVGPEAFSIKIFAIDGDFEVEDRDDWTHEEFDRYIAQPRQCKGPLLKGNCVCLMQDGVTSFSDIVFTDNSHYLRSGKFRLGARVVKGLPPGVEIREAVSKAFKVKERRALSYRRPTILNLEDGTRYLRHIGQIACQRLECAQIHTVKDFLQLYHTDAKALRKILQVSDNKWSEIVKDANSCSLTHQYYVYCDEASGVDLHLDCVFNVVRVTFNGVSQPSYRDLADSQKELVNKIRLAAYEKRHELPRMCALTNPTSMNAEFVSQSGISHSNMQHLAALVADTKPALPCVNSAISSMLAQQDLCKTTPNQTDQGDKKDGPSSLIHAAELALLKLMPSAPGMQVNETGNLYSQHKNFNTSAFDDAEVDQLEHPGLDPRTDTQGVVDDVNGHHINMSTKKTWHKGSVCQNEDASKRRRIG